MRTMVKRGAGAAGARPMQALAAMLVLGLVLAGCGEQPSPTPSPSASSPPAAALPEAPGPENAPGITLSDAVVRLPAVSGRPGVVYFTITQASGAPRKIAGVHIAGAGRAVMHESRTAGGVATMAPVPDVALEPGTTVEFRPGGLHVMLFDISDAVKAGTTAELTLTLDNGDKITAAARVEGIGSTEPAAAEMSGHTGMDHAM